MHLSDLKTKHVTELVEMAAANEIENANRMRKQDVMFALLKSHAKKGESIFGDGTLEILPDGFGFLRSPDTSMSAPARYAVSICTPGIPLKARFAPPRTENATSRW
jgi:transcription termination factor Rho